MTLSTLNLVKLTINEINQKRRVYSWNNCKTLQEYNGGLLLSRHRSDKSLTPESRAELQRVAKKFNLNFDDMCASNNEWCPENWQKIWKKKKTQMKKIPIITYVM